jgi:predicted AAA+ superfamily ATPase
LLFEKSKIMDRFIKLLEKKSLATSKSHKRFLFEQIDWGQRLSIILGHRGSGKTTMLLQRVNALAPNAIYLSLDDFYFETYRLVEAVDALVEKGYTHFFLDEVHRYKYWSNDLKNIYDNYPEINVVATGSSLLEVVKGQADLSRRAVSYYLPGLSFREFLQFEYNLSFSSLTLEQIIESHNEIALNYIDNINVEKAFQEYLKYGYYPFYKESKRFYGQRLMETTNLVLDVDVAPFEDLSYSTVRNMKKLMYIISQSVPFTPNIAKLSERMGVPRNSVLKILDLLHHAKIVSLLRRDTKGVSYLQKPEKIYLQNTNLAWFLSDHKPDVGNLRETFFLSQLEVNHKVTSSRFGDFMIDGKYTFEIGGPSKTAEQIQGVPLSYIAADGIKGGSGNKIPLWLLGFLY